MRASELQSTWAIWLGITLLFGIPLAILALRRTRRSEPVPSEAPRPSSQSDQELGLTDHFVSEGNVSLFRAERTTVLFGRRGDDQYRKVCQITFHKKTGAVYAQFTYFRTDPGVVGLITTTVGEGGQSSIDWKKGGKVASNLVKYSHPPDGNAHFSQDKHHQTQFWSESLNLHKDEGHLFEIHAFHLEPFESLKKHEVPKKGRLYLPFQADGLPGGFTLVGEWRSLASISQFAASTGKQLGPVASVPRKRDGRLFKAALLAPPNGCPTADHVLLLNLKPANPPPSATSPILFFMGGWSKQQRFEVGAAVTILSFMYPAGNVDELRRTIGDSDLTRDASSAGPPKEER